MDIQVGDRITYKYKGGTGIQYQVILDSTADLEKFKVMDSAEILKIERPKYEVIEEKKELLTEEEKEYLRNLIKFVNKISEKNIKEITLYRYSNHNEMSFYDEYLLACIVVKKKFDGLKSNQQYTLQELGLEK